MEKKEDRLIIKYPESFKQEVLGLFGGAEEDVEGVEILLDRGSTLIQLLLEEKERFFIPTHESLLKLAIGESNKASRKSTLENMNKWSTVQRLLGEYEDLRQDAQINLEKFDKIASFSVGVIEKIIIEEGAEKVSNSLEAGKDSKKGPNIEKLSRAYQETIPK